MRRVSPSSEEEMIAVFLRGELASTRFGPALATALDAAGATPELVLRPDLGDAVANELRRRLLAETRGYGTNDGLFSGFPDDVVWERLALTATELAEVVYIDYDYWIELSGGTRLPRDAARRIAAGVDVFGVPSEGFRRAAADLRDVPALPALILATAGGAAPLVVLEGHVRLTVLALRPDAQPDELEALVGTSPRMTEWALY